MEIPKLAKSDFRLQGNPHSQANHGVLKIACGRMCQKSSARLGEQISWRLCCLRRITSWLLMTVFLVIICLNKRMHYLSISRGSLLNCFPSSEVGFVLTHLCLLWPVSFFERRLGEIMSHSMQWKEKHWWVQKKAEPCTDEWEDHLVWHLPSHL